MLPTNIYKKEEVYLFFKSKKASSFLAYFILFIAGTLRFLAYYQNRSLFFDEINLARNIVEKPYSALFSNLDYDQHAPPFFSQTVKLCVDLFGVNEYALRLFPFLAGLFSLYLFYKIAEKWVEKPALWLVMLLFGFSIYLLEYGTEVKQYSVDVFVSCLLLFSTTRIEVDRWKTALFMGGIGAICLWFSMPSLFILVGVGFYYLYLKHSSLKKQNLNTYLPIFGMIGLWVVSFGLLFFINIKSSIGSSHLQDFHAQFFLKLPTSLDNIKHSGEILIGIMRSIVGKTTVPIVFGLFCFCIGTYDLFKNNKARGILVLIPIFTCFLASVLHFYSLIIRLTLFLFPLILLVLSIGFSFLLKKAKTFSEVKRKISLALLLGCSILCLWGRSGLPHLFYPFEKESARIVLEQLSQTDNKDFPIYVTSFGIPAQRFYTELYASPIVFPFYPKIEGKWSDNLIDLSKDWKQQGYTKIWIFDGHTHNQELVKLRTDIQQIGSIEEEYQGLFSFAVLIKIK